MAALHWRSFLKITATALISGTVVGSDLGSKVTISGWVIDSACAYRNALDKPIGAACAKACARNGSPLVILRDDGTIFLPIDSRTPSSSQNFKLMPFAGERVTVVGRDYTRNGAHGLVIEQIGSESH